MKHILLNKRTRETKPLCHFHHRFVFYIFNLHEIVSVRLINSCADYYQPIDKNGYFWGQYELQLSYHQSKNREETKQKKITRGFLVNVPYSRPDFTQKKKNVYDCEISCRYEVVPLLLMFFPVFNRIKLVPFKVVLNVTGRITDHINIGESLKNEEIVDLDLIALQKKEIPPNTDIKSKRSQAHNLYLDMLMEHGKSIQNPQMGKKIISEKAVINKKKR